MKRINLLVIVSLLLIACGEKNKSSSISGTISSLGKGTEIYLDFIGDKITTKDTAIIDENGNYHFKYLVEDLGYYRLRINNQNFINLILDKGDITLVNGDARNFINNYNVSGSEESARLKKINDTYKVNAAIRDSLYQVYQANPGNATMLVSLEETELEAKTEMDATYIGMINERPGSLSSLAAVELLNPDENLDLFKKVDNALAEKIANTVYYKKFHEKVGKLDQLVPGKKAPEITLQNREGQLISLSSLKGSIVLIDFWASWCGPCRAENPNVVKAYNDYRKKGFDVFSVSLDGVPQQKDAKQDWIEAINKDGLAWKNHVSDLKGWSSSVVPLYNIRGIPFTVLLDKEGTVIGKNIRGKALQQKLAELFDVES